MPRKKRTRGGKPKVAVKRKEEDDMSDVSMCSTTSEAPLSKEEIMARVIEEFRFGVQTKIQHLRAMANKANSEMKNLLKMELLKIPKEIRKMKVSEFVGAGGDINELVMNTMKPVEEPPVSFASQENGSTGLQQSASTVKGTRTAKRQGATKTPMVAQTTGRPTRGAKLRATAAISHLSTPAKGVSKIPMITPKVHPSMCMTASRNPKMGEMFYSLAGSPVTVDHKSAVQRNLPLKDGKSFLDMSPKTLAAHAESLVEGLSPNSTGKLKMKFEAFIQHIDQSTGYVATVERPKRNGK